MNSVIAVLVVIIVVLFAAKIYTDRQPNRGVSMHASPKRRGKLSSELSAATREMTLRDRLVDTEGRAAIGLTDDGQLVVVSAAWAARKSGEETVSFAHRTVDASLLVHVDVREPFYTERLKNGIGPIYVEAVELTVFVDDLDSPVFALNFLEDDELSGSPEHIAARDAATRWEGVIRALAFRAEGQRVAKGQLQALQSRARGA